MWRNLFRLTVSAFRDKLTSKAKSNKIKGSYCLKRLNETQVMCLNKTSALNPADLYIWDFGYHYNQSQKCFHLFYLNCDRRWIATQKPHFHARVGYAVLDFLRSRRRRWPDSAYWHCLPGRFGIGGTARALAYWRSGHITH